MSWDPRADRFRRTSRTQLDVSGGPFALAPKTPDGAGATTRSPAVRRVEALAARVAPLDLTVLIVGESGVGKERLAQWLHHASRRADGPFVAVNCGAFTDTLLESELFGHVRGAFTGAHQDRPGLFEAANGGTIFLDEIGEISPAMQVKVLRVLQEREVRRVGEARTRNLDVRVLAATNKDLRAEVSQHRFRIDLYYRLRVIELRVPALRERPEDLRPLVEILLQHCAMRLRGTAMRYTPRALSALLEHEWPGNIRELEHAIEHACAVAEGVEIDLDDLPDAVRGPHAGATTPAALTLAQRELAYLQIVLERHQGHRRRAAEELGISLSTLRRRLRATR